MNALITYDIRITELKEVYVAGCISKQQYDIQLYQYWLDFKAASRH